MFIRIEDLMKVELSATELVVKFCFVCLFLPVYVCPCIDVREAI